MIVLKGHKKDLGGGFFVRRILPSLEKRSVGPFVFFDHFGPTPIVTGEELVVRPHPHIGLTTITYLYDGVILHRDSLGTEALIQPKETNWMTGGRGIVHSERSQPDPRFQIIEGIQSWIALPKEAEEVEPRFEHLTESDIPVLQKEGIILRLLGGRFSQVYSPVNVFSPLFYADIEAEKGCKVDWPIPDFEESAIYVSRGSVTSHGQTLEPGDMAVFGIGEPVVFEALEYSRMVLLGGEPFPEKRHLYWNFVSTSPERIEQAKQEWKEDRFPRVPKETDRIPLPEG